MDERFVLDYLNPLTWLKTADYINAKEFDLVILDWVSPIMYPVYMSLFKRIKAKKMLICHNVLPHERRFFDVPLTRRLFKMADYFIVHSKKDHADLSSLKKNAQVAIGFMPLFDFFTPKKKEWKNSVLFFGIVRPYKGLHYLLDAIKKTGMDLTLIIAGEFWDGKENYLQHIRDLGIEKQVIIVDKYIPDSDVGEFFCADVLALPYIDGTQSAVLATAMSFSMPVITTNVGGLGEVIKDGYNGYVVPAKDSDALAHAIKDFFLKNKKKEFSENMKKEASMYTWERYAEIIENLTFS